MRKLFLFFIFIFLIYPELSHSKKSNFDASLKAQKFFDDLMDLASYNRKRDFYDDYIDKREMSFEEFSKIIDESDVRVEGAHKSSFVSSEGKGNEIEVFMRLSFRNLKKSENYEKNIKVILKKKEESLILPKKELLKIYSAKRSKKK